MNILNFAKKISIQFLVLFYYIYFCYTMLNLPITMLSFLFYIIEDCIANGKFPPPPILVFDNILSV